MNWVERHSRGRHTLKLTQKLSLVVDKHLTEDKFDYFVFGEKIGSKPTIEEAKKEARKIAFRKLNLIIKNLNKKYEGNGNEF